MVFVIPKKMKKIVIIKMYLVKSRIKAVFDNIIIVVY